MAEKQTQPLTNSQFAKVVEDHLELYAGIFVLFFVSAVYLPPAYVGFIGGYIDVYGAPPERSNLAALFSEPFWAGLFMLLVSGLVGLTFWSGRRFFSLYRTLRRIEEEQNQLKTNSAQPPEN